MQHFLPRIGVTVDRHRFSRRHDHGGEGVFTQLVGFPVTPVIVGAIKSTFATKLCISLDVPAPLTTLYLK